MNLSGSPLDFLAAFFAGVLVSFSPCVFPLVPVTAGYIGASSSASRFKGFLLSFLYVSGIALTYSLLGIFASLSGKLFGVISSYPLTNLIVGLIFVLFGLALFDLVPLSMPNFVRLPAVKEKGSFFAAFLLGLFSGLIIGPCTTPVLGAILLHIAQKKQLFYGALLLLSFAYGMGLLLIIVGTFSAVISGLKRFSAFGELVKKLSALILTGMGIYYVVVAIRRF